MAGLSSSLLQAGLALKINQVKRAASSYAHDRAAQGQGIVASYAVAAGLYAAAGIFLIAAVLVGVTALFRWIEINYGLFSAFGAIGGLLLLIAIICAGVAGGRLKRPAKQFPSLTSRLRVAIKANPIAATRRQTRPGRGGPGYRRGDPVGAGGARSPPIATIPAIRDAASRGAPNGRAALIVVATLMGWAMARRHNNARKVQRKVQV